MRKNRSFNLQSEDTSGEGDEHREDEQREAEGGNNDSLSGDNSSSDTSGDNATSTKSVQTPNNSDDEDVKNFTKQKGKGFKGKKSNEFCLNMRFESVGQFRQAVQDYALKNEKTIKFTMSGEKNVEARYSAKCPWRIYGSLTQMNEKKKKKHGGNALKNLLKVAKSTTEADFNERMYKMKVLSQIADDDFIKIDSDRFCSFKIGTLSKCEVIDDNMFECFIGYILKARTRLLIDILEDIKRTLMKGMIEKREITMKSGDTI
ncbi:hypothetical protein Cni_G29016 [Canna indica]|uniref:Transposase MuDR plant domain-containing protein n=1 Tax=Canna indica TaxID=4628 RepID=A0AAQ3L6H2_9LILI|nr:hypothetical protein Cni_G29016 [Canna indica]